MKTIDISPLITNDQEYKKIVLEIYEKYLSDWNDTVHDSFALFNRQLQDKSEELHILRCKAEGILKEAQTLKVNEYNKHVAALCREVDLI